jgi:hypothetical protein
MTLNSDKIEVKMALFEQGLYQHLPIVFKGNISYVKEVYVMAKFSA